MEIKKELIKYKNTKKENKNETAKRKSKYKIENKTTKRQSKYKTRRKETKNKTAKKESKYKIPRKENIQNKQETIEKSQNRLEVLKKIEELEREGKFDIDVENDPPTIVLTPENIDYLRKKMTSKLKRIFANEVGERFLDSLLKNNKLIIKEIRGMENFNKVPTGAIVTCNHFNPFDCFTVEKVFRLSDKIEQKRLYKVIREGNYTNFPGIYGFFFRNCDTLPLSSNKRTMIEFMKAVEVILNRGDFILIYPEQSMWWNYKKPKPLKVGAFKLAAKNNVPVIPIFITMEDSNIIGEDGFPVQEYIINIGEPIYPNEELSDRENTEIMKEKNFQVWKKIYEDFYKIPLEYTTEKEKVSVE